MESEDIFFQRQHPWVTLDPEDREQSDVLVATLVLGLLRALELDSIPLEMAERAIFNVGTVRHLERCGVSPELTTIIDMGENLGVLHDVMGKERYLQLVRDAQERCASVLSRARPPRAEERHFSWIDLRQ